MKNRNSHTRRTLLTIICIFYTLSLLGQGQISDSSKSSSPRLPDKYISVSTDIFQYIIYQPNIDASYKVNRVTYGLNFELVFPDPAFKVNVLSLGQYKWPGMVYNGLSAKFYFKYYYNEDKPRKYVCFQAVLKDLWYNNVSFIDMPDGDIERHYSMSETAIMAGLEILHGSEWGNNSKFHGEFFYGLGAHIKFRNFNVVYSDSYGNEGYMPLGNYKGYVAYPVFVLGMKLGYNFIKKE